MTIFITAIITFILTTILWFGIGNYLNKKLVKNYGDLDIKPIEKKTVRKKTTKK